MDKSVEATHEHFNSVRTGRAAPALLDRITIDYYGTPTPLKNLATINAPEPRMLTIQPFDPIVDQADREDDPGVRPRADAVERRQADPPADPAADRGAPQGARQARPSHGRGGPRRRPQRPPRRDQASRGARARTGTSATTRSGRPRARAEAHRRPRGADRRPAEAQRSRDHGGLGTSVRLSRTHPHARVASGRCRSRSCRRSRSRSRSSSTATAAGPKARACRRPPATAPARGRCGASSRRAIDLGIHDLVGLRVLDRELVAVRRKRSTR